MPTYYLEAFGIKQAQTRFERMGYAAFHAEPVMERVITEFRRIIDMTFQSQGRRGGGSWAQDSEEWLARKLRMNLDPRIGLATGALRRSYVVPDDENEDKEVGPNFARLGSLLEYAEVQQEHRPYIKLTKYDKVKIRNMIRSYLIDAWRASVPEE